MIPQLPLSLKARLTFEIVKKQILNLKARLTLEIVRRRRRHLAQTANANVGFNSFGEHRTFVRCTIFIERLLKMARSVLESRSLGNTTVPRKVLLALKKRQQEERAEQAAAKKKAKQAKREEKKKTKKAIPILILRNSKNSLRFLRGSHEFRSLHSNDGRCNKTYINEHKFI